jgi:hypothetical protein
MNLLAAAALSEVRNRFYAGSSLSWELPISF